MQPVDPQDFSLDRHPEPEAPVSDDPEGVVAVLKLLDDITGVEPPDPPSTHPFELQDCPEEQAPLMAQHVEPAG